MVEQENTESKDKEFEVTDNWREALRLCVANCNDTDVDKVLLAILEPVKGELANRQARPRAVLAALCLADEPNVQLSVARDIIQRFVELVDEQYNDASAMSSAAVAIAESTWGSLLREHLLKKLVDERSAKWKNPAWLLLAMSKRLVSSSARPVDYWIRKWTKQLRSSENLQALDAALSIMALGYDDKATQTEGLAPSLFELIRRGSAAAFAAVWALYWLQVSDDIGDRDREGIWKPTRQESSQLLSLIAVRSLAPETLHGLVDIAMRAHLKDTVQDWIYLLDHGSLFVRTAAAEKLGELEDDRAVEHLLACYLDEGRETDLRQSAVYALGEIKDKKHAGPLRLCIQNESLPMDLRAAAIYALGEIKDERSVGLLIETCE